MEQSVAELRTEARRLNAAGQFVVPAGVQKPGRWIADANRTDLLQALEASGYRKTDVDDEDTIILGADSIRPGVASGEPMDPPEAEPDQDEIDFDEERDTEHDNEAADDATDTDNSESDSDGQSGDSGEEEESATQDAESSEKSPDDQPESEIHQLLKAMSDYILETSPKVAESSEKLQALDDYVSERISDLQIGLNNLGSQVDTMDREFGQRTNELHDAIEQVGNRISELTKPMQFDIHTNGHKQEFTVDCAHKLLPMALRKIAAGEPVFLIGPAASGKTTAMKQVADALGLEFYPYSCGPEMTQFTIFGYNDANGTFQPGILFKPFTTGGLLLLDEIDRSNPAVLTALNAAIDNQYCAFPCGVQRAHESFRVVAAGNTYGNGYDHDYVGATRLDGSTLDRFTKMYWGYDEGLERRIFGSTVWTAYIQAARKAVAELGLKIIISPRASRRGNKLMAAGDSIDDAMSCLYSGVDKISVDKINNKIKSTGFQIPTTVKQALAEWKAA